MAENKYTAELLQFGTRIKQLRIKKKLSQVQLAEAIGINEKTIRRIESGEFAVGLNVLLSIAEGLEILPYKLLKGIDLGMK